MKSGVERELKFKSKRPVKIDKLGGTPLDDHTFSSVYHDTDDRRLLRAGITLRRRLENGLGLWQLKLPSGGDRLELEEPGGPAEPPASIAGVLSGMLRRRELEPIATLQTHRRGRRVSGVDVTLDEVEVMDGMSVVDRFAEIEAELVDGPPEAVGRVGRRLRKLGANGTGGKPKLLRVVKPPKPRTVSGSEPAPQLLQAMIEAQYDEVLRCDPIIRVRDDEDAVHDMRVAVRRLRSVLRTARPILEREWVESLREELDWLGETLGVVRDFDVLTVHLAADAGRLDSGDATVASGLLDPLRDEHERARERLRAALENPRYHRILDELEHATSALPVTRWDRSVRRLARKDFKRLRKRARNLERLDDAALHKLRIQGKRARYAAELAEPTLGKRAKRFATAASELQDVLGANQDAVVAVRRLRGLAHVVDRGDTGVVAGRLIAREEERQRRARRELPAVWRRVERCGKRAFG